MTREAAIDMLKGRKVYVNGQSKEIQEKLFELGFEWANDGKKVVNENWPFLYTSDTKRIQCGNEMVYFSRAKNTEISAEEIISIELEPDCPFKPFDKVLARYNDDMEWGARFFDRMVDGEYGCTDSLSYKQCISYEGHEHLLGTTKK